MQKGKQMNVDYIQLGDCLELMKAIPDGSIDMILCDLPYGVTQNKWDTVIPFDQLWKEYNRIIKDNGAIVLHAQEPFTSRLIQSNAKMFKYKWIWNKKLCTGFLNAKKQPLRNCEDICVFYKKQCTYNPRMRKGKMQSKINSSKTSKTSKTTNYGKFHLSMRQGDMYYPTMLLEFSKASSKSVHPTQKPIALLEYLIETYTNEGDVVLDNCMGSGSTCVACVNTKRHYIGFEKEQTYFDIAEKRIADARPRMP